MRVERKKLLMIAAGVIALVVIAAIVIVSFDINSYKSKIESAVSGVSGLEVKINGKMGLSFFPFGISARDIHIANKGREILSLENLRIGAELIPLMKKQLKITSCNLVNPVVTIVRDIEGKYNFEGTGEESSEGWFEAVSSLHNIRLSKGGLVYLDKKKGENIELKDFNLTVRDLSLGNTAKDIIRNASFSASMDCKEIFQKGLSIKNLKARAEAVRGTFNAGTVVIGGLNYIDKKSSEKMELKDFDLTVKDLSVADTSGEIIKNISFTGNMHCKEVRKKNLKVDNIEGPVKAEKGIFHLIPLTVDIFGGKGGGDAVADMSEAGPFYKINLKVSELDIEMLEESFDTRKIIGGKGDLFIALTMKEKGHRNLTGGMNGTFSLQGNNLVIYTMDLDKVLSKYEASQKFSLVDLGGFFIAGPLGTAALKGYRYADVYSETRGGRGAITKFMSRWRIKDGVAEATDCALATRHNRVALKGKLNLVSERYDNVVVALLDDKGCAKFRQSISGPFSNPQVGTVSTMESLAGPILDLYRKAQRIIQGGRCEIFYNGFVQQPR